MAKAAAKRILFSPSLPRMVSEVYSDHFFCYAWMVHHQSGTLPKPSALRALFTVEGPFLWRPEDVTWNKPMPTEVQDTVDIKFTVATANVLTLEAGPQREQQKGLMILGRIANLQRQFHEASCHIIAIQEARTHGALTRHSASHFVYQSGALPDGTKGCELWLDRSLPYAGTPGQQFCFHHDHVHVASFSERHLMCIIRAPHLSLRILVIHTPYEGAQDTTPEDWWRTLSMIVQPTPPDVPLLVVGDYNAKLGNITSEAISDLQASVENPPGQAAHAFLLEHRLWAPSTHEAYHVGDVMTYISPQGHRSRLDYVC